MARREPPLCQPGGRLYNGVVVEGPEPLIAQVSGVVLKRVTEDDLVLPALPWVLKAAARALGESPFAAGAVARALEPEPLAVARLMRMANGSVYSDGTPVTSITMALERLGPRTARIFLDDAGCDRMVGSRDPAINEGRQRAWEHGVAVGLVAQDLAALVFGERTTPLAESAYVGGLLHDLGKPVMAALLVDAERRLISLGLDRWIAAADWKKLVHGSHATVGRLLAVKWNFPTTLRQCVAEPYALDRWKPYAVHNFVCLANALVEQVGFDVIPAVDPAALDDVRAQAATLMGFTPEQLHRACQDLSARVSAHVGDWEPLP